MESEKCREGGSAGCRKVGIQYKDMGMSAHQRMLNVWRKMRTKTWFEGLVRKEVKAKRVPVLSPNRCSRGRLSMIAVRMPYKRLNASACCWLVINGGSTWI